MIPDRNSMNLFAPGAGTNTIGLAFIVNTLADGTLTQVSLISPNANGSNATTNTGGGGGSGSEWTNTGGNGASGIVILRMLTT